MVGREWPCCLQGSPLSTTGAGRELTSIVCLNDQLQVVTVAEGQKRCGVCVHRGAAVGSAVTFTFAGVAEHEVRSDQFCEHLSRFLQAVSRCVGGSSFLSCLSSSDFLLLFLTHLTITAASSPDLSASTSANCLPLSPSSSC